MKLRSSITKIAVATSVASLVLTACSGDTGGSAAESLEDMETITMTIPDVDAESGVVGSAWLEFAKTVEKESGGKIQVETYLSDSLMPYNEALGALRDGTVDMGRLIPNATPDELPVLNWYMKFGSIPTDSFPHGWLQSAGMTNEVHLTVPAFREEVESHNLVPLAATSTSQEYNLLCNKPVDGPEGLEGLRVRAGGDPWTSEVKALGMSPVSMLSPEAYEGLQRGTIECGSADPYQFMAYGWVEVADQFIPTNQTSALNNVYVVNKDFWDSLPQEGQKIVEDATEDLWMSVVEGYTKAYGEFADEIDKRDINVVDATEINKKLNAYRDEAGSKLPEIAPSEVEDPEAVLEDVKEIADSWLTEIVDGTNIEESKRDSATLKEDFKEVASLDLSFLRESNDERGLFKQNEEK